MLRSHVLVEPITKLVVDNEDNTSPCGDQRRYENNELSHFQNQAIVNELGDGGPISLDLTKAVARPESEVMGDIAGERTPAAEKKLLVNVEIIR